jgi:hypothetical protein
VTAPSIRNALLPGLAAWLVFTLLAGLAFFDRELWSDEAVTLLLATGHDPALIAPGIAEPDAIGRFYTRVEAGPLEVWRLAAAADNHPPGYPALLAALASLAGAETLHPGWLRVLNIALAALFVFPAFALARALGAGGRWLPLAVIAFSPFAFYLARELRPYGLVLPLALAAALLCLRFREGRVRAEFFLAAMLALNLAGCMLHKLFLGVVAAELAALAALAIADPSRRRRLAVLAAALAIGTLALAAPIPNLLTTAPTTGDFEAAWLHAPATLIALAEAVLRFLAYFLSWWITPPDEPFAAWPGIAFVAVLAPLALVLPLLALREAFRPHTPIAVLSFIAVPLAFLLAIWLVTGVDLSRSPRFSLIWVPFAAIWLTARLPHLPRARLLVPWTALTVAASSALVLAGYAHTSPDGARRFAATLPDTGAARLVWLDNGTLNARGLLVALDSELRRAGNLPERYEIVRAEAVASLIAEAAPPPGIVAASRRLTAEIRDACADGEIAVEGEYAACVKR